MALDPFPGDLVFFAHLMEFLPDGLILDRLPLGIDPSFANPAFYPFRHPLDQILRIGG